MERKRSVRRRLKQPFAQRAKDHCRLFTAFLFSNVGIIILVVLYITAGASMFMFIEGEVKVLDDMAKARNLTVKQLWNITSYQLNPLNRTMFNEEVSKRLLSYQAQITRVIRGGLSEHMEWNFSGALFYSLTVITTIGYGNLTPRTEWGKVATVVYAIIGMPLFLLYLSNIGDILAKSFKWIYARICLCRICPGVAKRRAVRERRKKRARSQHNVDERDYQIEEALENITTSGSSSQLSDEDLEEDDIVGEIEGSTNAVTVPITTCLMIMIGYIFLGAIIFRRWEGWQLMNGCYFCFISLSSIGFGDFVPVKKILNTGEGDTKEVGVTFILCAIYLLLGMALIAMCFNLMQEEVIYKMRAFKRGIRRCLRCDRNDSNHTP